ncbi:L-rhamnose isomerase [Parablautia intestinalis]|uniref:L-rhamnose isomerase n=1 Tax=Parablautia intestinalis TaxID=2320100 RepID=A0A3A9B2A5_9FIRM|nr:L-rhamnose isomerase [Parablautia intestinalis]
MMDRIDRGYEIAKEMYAGIGVDTDMAMERLDDIPVSMHCWQIDDLSGFENPHKGLTGGIQATGGDTSRAKNKEEFFRNLEKALALVPGRKKVALHAIYRDDLGSFVDRDAIEPAHFASWAEWAKEHGVGLDFNPTYFSHEKADTDFTLSSYDRHIREFWIEHGKRCRRISAYLGKRLKEVCINNHWIPDGYKDLTVDRQAHRELLLESMNQIMAEKYDPGHMTDSWESKLFGLGLESYTVGSHEFYTNYAMSHENCMVCMDMGHFHPTEQIADKMTSYLAFGKEVMLHVSRPVRWDSDHVVILSDEVRDVMTEICRQNAFDRVHIGTDYFDASINRVAAQALGARSIKQALLYGLLEPAERLKKYELEGDYTRRLAYIERQKAMPFGLVWDKYCQKNNVPAGDWVESALYG